MREYALLRTGLGVQGRAVLAVITVIIPLFFDKS